LRYFGIILAILLIVLKLIYNKGKVRIEKVDRCILIFYCVMFLSLIQWGFNGIKVYDRNILLNLIILNVYNNLACIVFIIYKPTIDFLKLNKYVVFAGIILLISIIIVYFGVSIPSLLMDTSERQATIGTVGGEHYNLFGQPIRVSGFAEDANYATLFSVITIVYSVKIIKKTKYKTMAVILGLLGVALSFSRTVLLGVAIAGLIYALSRILKVRIKNFENIILVLILICAVIIPYVFQNVGLQTLSTRFSLWRRAYLLFKSSPVFGNGMGAFRYYNSSFYKSGWVVQCHSTYWQILSENGIIGMVAFVSALWGRLKKIENEYFRFLWIIFIVFAFNFETIYLQYFVFTFCLMREDVNINKISINESTN
jgi:hypothetical protein